MKPSSCIALLTLLVVAAACGKEEPHATPPDTEAPASEPLTRPGTLRIEGMEQPVTLVRVAPPEAPFTTWMPEGDFAVESEQAAATTNVWFRWQAGGTPAPQVYVRFAFPQSGDVETTRASLLNDDGLLAREGWQAQVGPSPCLWAVDGGSFSSADGLERGIWCVGEHAGRPFYLVTPHPAEYGDGFGPRLDVLLDAFRWNDTGAPLTGE